MRLPGFDVAKVPKAKIVDYLLARAHPAGRSKARFFEQFGFDAAAWEVLAVAIARHAEEHDVNRGNPVWHTLYC